MKVLILGSWREELAKKYQKQAEQAGRELALRGYEIVSGGGTGISEIVVNAYRQNKGKRFTAYFPSKRELEKIGEEPGPKPDKAIWTGLNHLRRNIVMVEKSEAILAFPGSLGTFNELIYAVYDYHKKIAVMGFDEMADWIRAVPKVKQGVFLTKEVSKAIDFLEK